MTASVDVQRIVIGVGILVAAVVMLLGPFVGAGDESVTAAAIIFAATFGVLSLFQLSVRQLDIAGAYALAAVGWVLVLLGRSGLEIALGLGMLAAGGGYVARVMLARTGNPRDVETG